MYQYLKFYSKILYKYSLIFLPILYIWSGSFYFIYYSFFDIDIFNYITFNDLIFYGLKQIPLILLFLFFLYKLTNFISSKTVKVSFKIYNHFSFFKKKNIITLEEFKLVFEIILAGLLIALFIIFYTSAFISLTFLNLFLIIRKNINKNNQANKIKFESVVILFFGSILFYFILSGFSLPNENLNYKNNDYISFYSEGTYYSTKNTNFNYNGETSQYIFLYDYKNDVSLIFFKENINDFKKENNSHVIKIRNLFK